MRKPGPAASDSRPRGAFDLACRYLASRERCAAQVRAYLERRGADADEIDTAIRHLREKRLVDDLRYARLYVEVRSRRSPRSGAWLVRELIEDGVDRETAQLAVSEFLNQVSEDDLARRILAKLSGRDRKDLQSRAVQRLRARGFPASIAFRWAKEQGAAGQDVADHREGNDRQEDEDRHEDEGQRVGRAQPPDEDMQE